MDTDIKPDEIVSKEIYCSYIVLENTMLKK
jgi:hypothetical protein